MRGDVPVEAHVKVGCLVAGDRIREADDRHQIAGVAQRMARISISGQLNPAVVERHRPGQDSGGLRPCRQRHSDRAHPHVDLAAGAPGYRSVEGSNRDRDRRSRD